MTRKIAELIELNQKTASEPAPPLQMEAAIANKAADSQAKNPVSRKARLAASNVFIDPFADEAAIQAEAAAQARDRAESQRALSEAAAERLVEWERVGSPSAEVVVDFALKRARAAWLNALVSTSPIVFGPPFALLAVGSALLWAFRGFGL